MTDRINGCFVIFDRDIREDDAQATIDAIRHIKGVLDVKKNISNPSDAIAQGRAKHDLIMKIYEVLK